MPLSPGPHPVTIPPMALVPAQVLALLAPTPTHTSGGGSAKSGRNHSPIRHPPHQTKPNQTKQNREQVLDAERELAEMVALLLSPAQPAAAKKQVGRPPFFPPLPPPLFPPSGIG